MSYVDFIRNNARFVGFGVLTMAFSGFGQTYMIGLYNSEILQTFDLSKSDFGLIYSVATLTSGFLLVWSGQFIDWVRLSWFTSFVMAGLIASCFLMALSSGLPMLFLALFMMRHFGQGLCTHTSSTAIARAYNRNRGRALALSHTGLPLSEALYPMIAVFLIMHMGWQQSWMAFALFLLFVGWPLALWLGRAEHTPSPPQDAPEAERATGLSRREVLKDWTFYPITLFLLSSPLLLTGLFFQHTVLVAERGWAITSLATAFVVYAVIKVLIALLTGALVDRFSAVRVLPFTALPAVGAYIFLSNSHNMPETTALVVYMSLVGLNVGSVGTCGASLWPELYGIRHLGSIKSLTGALFILSTSLSPFVSALLLDSGWLFEDLVRLSLYVTLGTLGLLVPTLALRGKSGFNGQTAR